MRYFTSLIFFLFLVQHSVYGQEEVEQVRIEKDTKVLYQGARPDTQQWYLYVESNQIAYMANLTLSKTEVNAWFEKFKNSQNIFKGIIQGGAGMKTIRLEKENEPESSMLFYFEKKDVNTLLLTSFTDGEIFVFNKINLP